MAAKSVPSALKLKICKDPIRKNGTREPCGARYVGERCPNKGDHILKISTGFCSNGWHEGTKSTDWRGNPVPTCAFIYTCPCDCHDQLDKLFAMTGAERLVVDSSGYQPPQRTFWMPTDDPEPVLSSPSGPTVPEIIESPAPDLVPATIKRDFDPTPTGRAARGELELWVKHQCDIWLIDQPGDLCTPKYLAEEIGRDLGIMPPSVGAIGAVFDRWVSLGFAVCERKPVRFIRYTDEGIKKGLERLKAEASRKAKMQRAQQRRGIR